MSEIRAVLFDYGQVLSGPPDPISWRRMQAILGAANRDFHDTYWRHRHDYDLGVLNGPGYWRAVASDLDASIDEAQLDALIDADVDLWTQPNEPMIEWAQALQSRGVATAILSNIGDAMESGILEQFPWLARFTHHTFSHRLGIAKPDERIYRLALSGLGVAAEEALFVGDRIENVEAARRVGIHAIQYVSHGQFLREFESCGFSGVCLPGGVTAR